MKAIIVIAGVLVVAWVIYALWTDGRGRGE
jgi:hypothetical protein